jgi:hypothetical protein
VHAETAKLRPLQARAAALRSQAEQSRARARWLDEYRGRTRRDLDLLNEFTKLVEPPAWTNSVVIGRDTVRLQGEAPQATALWKILDSSRILNSSKLEFNQPATGGGESFLISGTRVGAK